MPVMHDILYFRLLSPTCQMMFFSATYDTEVMEFANTIVSNPTTITVPREEESLDNIKQYYVVCQSLEDKYQAITNIYGVITIGQAMIFCRVRFAILFKCNIYIFSFVLIFT